MGRVFFAWTGWDGDEYLQGLVMMEMKFVVVGGDGCKLCPHTAVCFV